MFNWFSTQPFALATCGCWSHIQDPGTRLASNSVNGQGPFYISDMVESSLTTRFHSLIMVDYKLYVCYCVVETQDSTCSSVAPSHRSSHTIWDLIYHDKPTARDHTIHPASFSSDWTLAHNNYMFLSDRSAEPHEKSSWMAMAAAAGYLTMIVCEDIMQSSGAWWQQVFCSRWAKCWHRSHDRSLARHRFACCVKGLLLLRVSLLALTTCLSGCMLSRGCRYVQLPTCSFGSIENYPV